MDFVDWRNVPDKEEKQAEQLRRSAGRLGGARYQNYLEEIIQEAQQRGEFDNLPNMGKPLSLEDDSYAGDKNLAYHLLKNNHMVPPEVALVQEIQKKREELEKELVPIKKRYQSLRAHPFPPTHREKLSFNEAWEKATAEYEDALRALNKRILTLNLSTPSAMHQPLLQVEEVLRQFRQTCPPFGGD